MKNVKIKRYTKIILALVIAVSVAAVGTTLAFMFRKAAAKNSFVPANVTCRVHERFEGGTYTEGEHNGTKKSDIKVENTGNTEAYIRLRLVPYWRDADGNTLGIPSVMPTVSLYNNSGWMRGSNDTYYYTSPIKPEELTPVLCRAIVLGTSVDAEGNTVYQTLEVFAEAIQSSPDKAAEEAWGVTVENGRITETP